MAVYYKVIVVVSLSFIFLSVTYLNFKQLRLCTERNVTSVSQVTEISQSNQSAGDKSFIGKKSANICKECVKDIPNVIVQYGPHRSASTLQFYILCLMMLTLHEDEANSVSCFFGRGPPKKYKVIKTHTFHFSKLVPRNTAIFMTSNDMQTPDTEQDAFNLKKKKLKKENFNILKIVDTRELSQRGIFIAYDYQSIFGVSDKQMEDILEYLRYWDILRLCCGKEMSSDWRNKLSPQKWYKAHYNSHDAAYPACEMYNISQVELLFINTIVYKKFTQFHSVSKVIGRPSKLDGALDGHYCERCNRNIAKFHIHSYKDKCA